MATSGADIGVTGLATMGRNLARNFARHGHTVAVHNRTDAKTRSLIEDHGDEGAFVPSYAAEDFVASLARPRKVVIMVKAGAPTDAVIEQMSDLLEPGDILVDAGNAHWLDTRRREQALAERGIHFVGTGVSGGEEGALHGPSIMPGGTAESYESLGPLLESIAAQVDGTPCCTHVGPGAAGHFVKMVHNGIEYADMQLIAEAYDLLRRGAGLDPAELAGVFRSWNEGDLESYLIEITATVLDHVDASSGRPFVDVVVDEAEQKGTGRWTVQSALELGTPVSGIAEAVFARALSGHVEQRASARSLPGAAGTVPAGDVDRLRRGRPPRPVRVEGRRLRAGLRPDRGRQRVGGVGHRPRRHGHDLAGWLHHPGPLPRRHPSRLRRRPRPLHPAGRSGVRRRARRRPGRLASGGGDRSIDRDRHARASRRPSRTTTACAPNAARRR